MTESNPQTLRLEKRFLRSTNLERDWSDPNALEDYVITDLALQACKLISKGFRDYSSLRAWRITGDYGTGKSSFALFLAHLLEKGLMGLPDNLMLQLRKQSDFWTHNRSPTLLPLLITGRKESIRQSLLNALIKTLEPLNCPLVEGWLALVPDASLQDRTIINAIDGANKFIRTQGSYDGLLILIDEAGKYLEMAVSDPENQDIFLLQELAEIASRSGSNPILVLSIFHQGIDAYAQSLPVAQQREWEKIAGRYDEILWNQPIGQVTELIVAALNGQTQAIAQSFVSRGHSDMEALLKLRWFESHSREFLMENHGRLYPLHPTVIPALVKLFAVYGQNERSLFTFLLGGEPFGLQDFLESTQGKEFYQLNHLYDYVRANLGSKMHLHSFRNHWREIDSSISIFAADDARELEVLKVIGLLNILNSDSLVATSEILQIALGERYKDAVVDKLLANHVIFNRGISQGLCLWPHSSVNLDRAYREAVKQNVSIVNVVQSIETYLDKRPIVARRHYIETGNLRYFEVVYCEASKLRDNLRQSGRADGRIVIPLMENVADHTELTEFATSELAASMLATVIAIPQSLYGLEAYLLELRRWEWVDRNTSGLQRDSFAKEEVDRQVAFAGKSLRDKLHSLVGVLNFRNGGMSWYWRGEQLTNFSSDKSVLQGLSDVFDVVFRFSPKIHNELINRRIPSSSANKVKMALIERLIETPNAPFIGLDDEKRPPEFSMYLSVLGATGLHRQIDNRWQISIPDRADADIANLSPVFEKLHSYLTLHADEKVFVQDLYQQLQYPPYGVREGLLPVILAVYYVAHEDELAFYEDQTFLPRMTGGVFFRLMKSPETFEIQLFPHSALRSQLFVELARQIVVSVSGKEKIELLDVARPMFIFAAGLPQFTQRTSNLSMQSLKIREILLRSKDPARLLFIELPQALGFSGISDQSTLTDEGVRLFVDKLRDCIDELRACYPRLIKNIGQALSEEFHIGGQISEIRSNLETRVGKLINFVSEIRLKGFCLRLVDTTLPEEKWLESIASYICSMPPAKWKDADLNKYNVELNELVSKLLRVEAVIYSSLDQPQKEDFEAMRVFLTQVDGQEREKILHISASEKVYMANVEKKLHQILEPEGALGVAALSRVLWQILKDSKM